MFFFRNVSSTCCLFILEISTCIYQHQEANFLLETFSSGQTFTAVARNETCETNSQVRLDGLVDAKLFFLQEHHRITFTLPDIHHLPWTYELEPISARRSDEFILLNNLPPSSENIQRCSFDTSQGNVNLVSLATVGDGCNARLPLSIANTSCFPVVPGSTPYQIHTTLYMKKTRTDCETDETVVAWKNQTLTLMLGSKHTLTTTVVGSTVPDFSIFVRDSQRMSRSLFSAEFEYDKVGFFVQPVVSFQLKQIVSWIHLGPDYTVGFLIAELDCSVANCTVGAEVPPMPVVTFPLLQASVQIKLPASSATSRSRLATAKVFTKENNESLPVDFASITSLVQEGTVDQIGIVRLDLTQTQQACFAVSSLVSGFTLAPSSFQNSTADHFFRNATCDFVVDCINSNFTTQAVVAKGRFASCSADEATDPFEDIGSAVLYKNTSKKPSFFALALLVVLYVTA